MKPPTRGSQISPTTPHPATSTAPEPRLNLLNGLSQNTPSRFLQQNPYGDPFINSRQWSLQPNLCNYQSTIAPQWFPQSNLYNDQSIIAPQWFPQSNLWNDQSTIAPQWFSQSDLNYNHSTIAPQWFPQSNLGIDQSSITHQWFPQSDLNYDHSTIAPQLSLRPNLYNNQSTFPLQGSLQSDQYGPFASSTSSSALNLYHDPFTCAPQGFHQSSDSTSAWQRPHLPSTTPYLATFAPPTQPMNQFNSSYMQTPHTVPAPSSVLGMRPFNCDQCSEQFTWNQDLIQHKSLHPQKAFKCNRCRNTYVRKQDLQEHQENHPQLLSFERIIRENDLKQHKNTHHEGASKCELCRESFMREQDLQEHQKTHFGPFMCIQCSISFQSFYDLKEHNCILSEGIFHRCDQCPQTFRRRWNLARHREIEHAVTPFICGSCGGMFLKRKHLWVRFPRIDSGFA